MCRFIFADDEKDIVLRAFQCCIDKYYITGFADFEPRISHAPSRPYRSLGNSKVIYRRGKIKFPIYTNQTGTMKFWKF